MLKKYFLKIIGLLIFVILLIKIDLKKAFVIIANAQLGFVILAFVLAFIIFLIRTWRWQSVLKAQGNKYNFFDLIKSGLGGGYFASITPGQVGDFIKVYYLKQYGKITSGKAVSSILLDRFMNIPVLLVISVIALYFFNVNGTIKTLLIAIFLLFLVGLIIILPSERIIRKICGFLFKIKIIGKKRAIIKKQVNEFYKGFDLLLSFRALIPIIISLLALLVVFLQSYIIAAALMINIAFIDLAVAVSVSMVIALIPISFLGIGTRDLAVVLVFTAIGISAEQAISFSFLFLLTHYIFIAAIGAYFWFKYPVKIKDKNIKNIKSKMIDK